MRRREIERLLPNIMRRAVVHGSPLAAILDVMESLHAPVEEAIRQIDRYFSPYRTPDDMVPLLARWVDLDRFFLAETPSGGMLRIPQDVGQLRELVAAAAQLSQWRGTKMGLQLFLETATGVPGFQIDEVVAAGHGTVRPFHFRVRVPEGATLHRALVEQIIEQERPAHLTYEILYAAPGGADRPHSSDVSEAP